MKTFLLFPLYFRPFPQASAASLFHGAKKEIEEKIKRKIFRPIHTDTTACDNVKRINRVL